ncbi:COQ9 family protein [Fertoebacter nigrum]|uniref:COQ9 family protein n=1 Tax=Fertoeibacter niger TaxID=2656921 RepID=A0A8X8H7F2_9RHOB|nr:COQ9 family protein [Fertoeibacter niger]NUB44731.1 COQ9 family protein [Fertoeibacter niger]
MEADMTMERAKDAILDAALPHVPFDGWSAATLRAAVSDSGVAPALAQALYPRGAVDLALAYHARGDALMTAHAATADLAALRYSERVAALIRFRLEAAEKEAVRRGTTLFALPHHAPDGARAIWGTADAIWQALGDTSADINWYTKRATLSGVYAATVLYWLGDDSPGHHATWDFLDRRIADVMQIEKMKASLRDNAMVKAVMDGPLNLFAKVKMPTMPDDLPGMFRK